MFKNRYIKFVAMMVLMIFSRCQKQEVIKNSQPNILLIITDDQAYGDLSLTGNRYAETPVIDKLAEEGVFAKQFYVSPVCAPTRASLLTGRYHQRTGVSGVTRGRENMNLDETTLANILQTAGYNTGAFGKWHNGAHFPYHPLGRGFNEFVGFTSGHWTNYFNTTIEKNGKALKTSGYLPDILTDEAISFIEKCNTDKKPFFCYVPYQTPHTPLQVPDVYFDKYKNKGVDDFNATIYGMAENIDNNVGRILKKLETLDIKKNTIIIYMSDNGPLNLRYNAGLKGKKGSVNQGGIKVPFIINWKDKIATNKTILTPLAHIDILPTLLDLIHINHDYKKPIDGKSFKSLLTENNDKTVENRNLFAEWNGNKRVRSGDYLLINEELFNIVKDASQTYDVRSEIPKVYDSLLNTYQKWFASLPAKVASKPILVGYEDYPITHLPAHEANLFPPFEFRKDRKHTGIAYHSLYGWAHDWIDFWTKTEAFASWDIEVIEDGEFEIEMKYALAKENVGAELMLEVDNQQILIDSLESFEHSEFQNFDRVERGQEAPETDWNTVTIGQLRLTKGVKTISLKAIKINGEKTIELKGILLNKKNE
ncbi:arylsulfatase [uncultured Polaribacter sp.]|uniref:arylsulfatase n=1 Tax=uncultured Polaribacter sp. TaxID=174711 RepID=UPI00261BC8CB|nr:arylsulfatase [uncultured Polaribacter sp.]